MSPRLIAYYLPQYHPIPENDRWWGRGFTEWTNVSRAQPLFDGHRQPRLPDELGFYDLRVAEVMQQQAALAREYGVHGFCYYAYWFEGGKRLLERPIEQMLRSGQPDFPFCLCWANENWTRRWDGGEHEILMPQDHTLDNNLAFFRAMVPYLQDPRYIRVDGKPLLLVYRTDIIPDLAAQVPAWRQVLREAGVGEVHLVAVQSFIEKNPLAIGFDAACDFPPHLVNAPRLNPGAEGEPARHDYRWLVSHKTTEVRPPWPQYRGVLAGWDNTPRRKARGALYEHGSPQWYGHWLEHAIVETHREQPAGERLVFINAWNEWAEGAVLEPDHLHGRAYLEATHSAVARAAARCERLGEDDPAEALAPWAPRLLPQVRAALQAQLEPVPPRFLVVVDAGSGADAQALDATLQSLARQSYPHLHLLLAGEGAVPTALLARCQQVDAVDLAALSDACREVAQEQHCTHLLRLSPGDRLLDDALLLMAQDAAAADAPAVVYGDDARYDGPVQRAVPDFKPDFDPDLLRSLDYVGPGYAIRTEVFAQLGGWRAQFTGVEAYDLLLRTAALPAARVAHVRRVLLLRRAAFERSARIPAADLLARGRRAVTEHLEACGEAAEVAPGVLAGSHRVVYRHTARPRVSIIVPTRDQLPLLERCVTSLLEKTAYPDYEVLIINNDSREAGTLAFFAGLRALGDPRLRVIDYPHPFNFSAMMNLGAEHATGDVLLLLNNDTAVLHADWIDALLVHGLRPEVGAVGARLLFPDGLVQHAGVSLGVLGGFAGHFHGGMPAGSPGSGGRLQVDQQFSAVTAACLMVRKAVYREVGGFDADQLPINWNDVDFCLRLRSAGYRVLWTPFATLLHEQSKSLTTQLSEAQFKRSVPDGLRLWERHLARIARDPHHSPSLTIGGSLALPERDPDLIWYATPGRPLPRVLGIACDRDGIGQYRLMQPLAQLQRDGLAETKVIHRYLNPALIERFEPDALVMQRPFVEGLQDFLDWYRRFGRYRRIIELDDLITEVPAYNPHRAHLPKNIERLVRYAFDRADCIVVSTEPLAHAYAKWHHDIRVLPNRLPSSWRHLKPKDRGRRGARPRVGWAGGVGHDGDLRLLADVVTSLADEVDWVFLGAIPAPLREHAAEVHEGVPFDLYPQALADLQLDVALAPLAVNRYNECKSNLRLLEYGALGTPVVATDIAPFRCGLPVTLVANRSTAWIGAIRALAFDPDAARQAGAALRSAVLGSWMLDQHPCAWASAVRADRPMPVAHGKATVATI